MLCANNNSTSLDIKVTGRTKTSNGEDKEFKQLQSQLKIVKSFRSLKDKNGRNFVSEKGSYGYLSLHHWKEGNKYSTQWYYKEGSMPFKAIGSVYPSSKAINVHDPNRNKFLKDKLASFVDIEIDDIDLFLSEVVDISNYLGENLFPADNESIEESVDSIEINGFEDYPENVKSEAIDVFKNNPFEFFIDSINNVHYGDSVAKKLIVLAEFSKHVRDGKPVHLIIVGSTESGKTSLANKTAKITPNRFFIETNSMSSKAVFYHQNSFREDHNHFIINDFMDSPEAIGTLKAITDTEIDIPKHMTVSDDKKPLELRFMGKNTVIITAAKQLTDKELNRRLLHLNPDESEKNQEKTKKFIINEEIVSSSEDHEATFEVCKAVYDKIIEEGYKVFVPWLKCLNVNAFNKTDIKHFANLVKASALINRSKRQALGDNTIVASIEDLMIVSELWKNIKNIQDTYLPEKAFRLVEKLPKWDTKRIEKEGHYGWKIKKAANEIGVSRNTLERYLNGENDQIGLIDLGLVHSEKEGTSIRSPRILYKKELNGDKTEEEACAFVHSRMNKTILVFVDKREIIRPICTLVINEGTYKGINEEDLVNSVSEKYDKEIETDENILEIVGIVEEEIQKLTD